ncbi:uncharacterized protein [Pempheris klunzingeri]|uniref:uncharacterized protein n=1 Tax=Pempheris klunzingeri TaxID=3127111 RepID=UPI00397FEEDF
MSDFEGEILKAASRKRKRRLSETYDRPCKVFATDDYSRTFAIRHDDEEGRSSYSSGVYATAGVGLAHVEWSHFEATAKGPNIIAGAETSQSGTSAFVKVEVASASASAGPDCEAEVKGPNVGAEVTASRDTGRLAVKAETVSCSISAGPCVAEAKGPNATAEIEASDNSIKALVKAEVASVSATAGPVTGKLGLSADTGASISPKHVEVKLLGTGFSASNKKISLSAFGTGLELKFW